VERRIHARIPLRAIAYVELGQENGGLILNLSEGGIAVQAGEILAGVTFQKMRFRLSESDKWIEVGGKVMWEGPSRKEAGINPQISVGTRVASGGAGNRSERNGWFSTATNCCDKRAPGSRRRDNIHK